MHNIAETANSKRAPQRGKLWGEESLFKLGSVMTSPVPQWTPREIVSGAWMASSMAVHQDAKITPSPYFPLIILGSSGEWGCVQKTLLFSFKEKEKNIWNYLNGCAAATLLARKCQTFHKVLEPMKSPPLPAIVRERGIVLGLNSYPYPYKKVPWYYSMYFQFYHGTSHGTSNAPWYCPWYK